MKTLIAFLGIGFMVSAAMAAATPSRDGSKSVMWRDFDGDGRKEATVLGEKDGKIRLIAFDMNGDDYADGVVYYSNGHRDRAEQDTDFDGKTDVWISYYFTGVPWKRAEDLNRDGRADYWVYFKQNVVYRWEQDRNFDGKPDVRTLFDVDGASAIESPKFAKQAYDNDFDGRFEDLSGRSRRPEVRIPHSLAEALLGINS